MARKKKTYCPDCGKPGERKGHQECQYPSDYGSRSSRARPWKRHSRRGRAQCGQCGALGGGHFKSCTRRRGRRHGNDGPVVTSAPAPAAPAAGNRYKKRRTGMCIICGSKGHGWQSCPHHGDKRGTHKKRNARTGRFTRRG